MSGLSKRFFGLFGLSLLVLTWPFETSLACHTTPQGRPACPTLAVNGSNEIYVVYLNHTPRDIFFTRSLDGGVNWSAPVNISDNPGESVRPTIALAPEGKIYVAWGDNTDAPDGPYDVFLRSSTDGGVTWSPLIKVTSAVTSSDRLPSIAVDSNGTLYVAWTKKKRKKENGTTITHREAFLKYSLDGGETWSPAYSVSRRPSRSDVLRTDITIDPTDNIYILWDEAIAETFEVYMSKGSKP
jgi:hypothetical protein